MRRGLASLIIGLSLVVASLSWAGFILSRTVLDPGRSERLAAQLLEHDGVREALARRLADSVEPQIPADVPIPRSLIEAGADTALDDPEVQALILDAVVRFHRNALEGNAEPVVVESTALGGASREALVGVRPELDAVLPPAPSLELELPTAGFTWLASVKRFVDRWTLLGALAATAGATVAFAVARNRAAVLRRVAFWGYGAAAFWLLVGYAVPWIANTLSPTSGAIAAAAVDVFFGAMIGPAIVMAAGATALLALGFLLPMFGRRRAAGLLQPSGPRLGGRTVPAPVATAVPSTPPTDPTLIATTTPIRRPTTPPGPGSSPLHPTGPGSDATREMPRPMATSTPGTGPGTGAGGGGGGHSATGTSPPWREGVGYLDEAERR